MLKNLKKIVGEFLYKIFSIFSPYLFKKIINNNINDCETILDLGYLRGSLNGCEIRKKNVIGMDIFGKYLSELKSSDTGYKNYINSNIMNVDKYFGENSIDCIVMIEIIEYLKETDTLELLNKIEKIAKKKIIINTPNGFLKQTLNDGNEYQRHLSGYDVDFFNKHGFDKIYGIWGYKKLRGEFGMPVY